MFRRAVTVRLVSVMSWLAPLTGACLAAPPPPGVYLTGRPADAIATNGVAVSADGSWIVGNSYSDLNSRITPFVWSYETGRVDFPNVGIIRRVATGISGDGTTIIGQQENVPGISGGGRAFRQRVGGVYEDIGPSAGYGFATTVGVNMDGTAVTGLRYLPPHPPSDTPAFGYIWREGDTMRSLGSIFPGDSESSVEAMSRDGSTIVGSSGFASRIPYAWRAETGMRALPGGTAEFPYASVLTTNGTGSTHAGRLFSATTGASVLCLWSAGVQQIVGRPSGTDGATVFAISDDASVMLCGAAPFGLGRWEYYIWSSRLGFLPFRDYLSLNGVSVPDALLPRGLTGMSGDGRTFVGAVYDGVTSTGSIYVVPSPGACFFVLAFLVARNRRARSGG